MAAILTFPKTGVALAEDGLQQRKQQCTAYLKNKWSPLIFILLSQTESNTLKYQHKYLYASSILMHVIIERTADNNFTAWPSLRRDQGDVILMKCGTESHLAWCPRQQQAEKFIPPQIPIRASSITARDRWMRERGGERGVFTHCFAVRHNGAVKHNPPLQGKVFMSWTSQIDPLSVMKLPIDEILSTGLPYGKVSVVGELVLDDLNAQIHPWFSFHLYLP